MIPALLVLAAIALPPESETWLKADVAGFHILSNASRADTERIVSELVSRGPSPILTRVFIVRDLATLGVGVEVSGKLLRGDNENVILIQAKPGEAPRVSRGDAYTEAPRAEVLAEIGHLFARMSDDTFVQAEIFLTEALKLDPTLPLAHLDLAHINSTLGMRSTSEAHYSKVSQSEDAQVLVLYGAAILARLAETKSKEDVALARSIFERAAKIDPESPRAHAGVGATYVVSVDDPSAGIVALEKSLALAPSQDDVAVNLTTLLARAGRRTEAQRLFDTVVSKSTDPNIVNLGRRALHRLQQKLDDESLLEDQVKIVESAMAAANAGRFDEALKTIDDVLPAIKDAEFKGSVTRLRSEIAKKVLGARP